MLTARGRLALRIVHNHRLLSANISEILSCDAALLRVFTEMPKFSQISQISGEEGEGGYQQEDGHAKAFTAGRRGQHL